VSESKTDEIPLVVGTTVVFQYDRVADEVRVVMSGEEPFDGREVDTTIVVHAGDEPFQPPPGLHRDSSAEMVLADLGVDSLARYPLKVRFLLGDRVLVVLEPERAMTRELLEYVCEQIIFDLDQAEADEDENIGDLAMDARWIVVRALKARLRAVEDSVRHALADEYVSSTDYDALREYPTRLAMIERLASDFPLPTWESHRGGSRLLVVIPDFLPKSLREVGGDAKDAVARLSGLISSQQVVVAQRQAAETARFQRLLTLVGTAVLVPGLVAAVFGANVDFRGRDSVQGLWAMLLFMTAGGTGSYALVRSFETQLWSRLARRLKIQDWLAKKSEDDRLVLLVAVTLVATALGTVLLICA
jgi:hypothetical protein